jgi:hypothetical protein
MRPVLFLRIASVITLIHSALHTIGGVFGKPSPGVAATTLAIMRANTFDVLGVTRSYWDFMRGMGLDVTIFLTVEAVVFWQLGTLAKTDAPRLRPILASFLVAYLTMAVNASVYIFLGPVITEVLIALCLGMAIVTAKAEEPVSARYVVANRV